MPWPDRTKTLASSNEKGRAPADGSGARTFLTFDID